MVMVNWPCRRVQSGALSDNDIIIVLMGPTGSGKSSFIATLTGVTGIVGHGLASMTKEIGIFRYTIPEVDSTICLVDTPGLDDTVMAGHEIFGLISEWLIETYSRRIGLAGLLYFHNISDNRMTGSALDNLIHFQRLCENELDRVVLTTTMWDDVDAQTGSDRENELQEVYWKPLISRGSSVKRFLNDRTSAIDILLPIIQAAQQSNQRNAPQRTVGRVSAIRWLLNEYAVVPLERFQGRAATAITDLWQSRLPARLFVFVGPYGGGKSQFIDCLTRETKWANHTMTPHLHPIRFVTTNVPNGNGSVVLVDTEGFSDIFANVNHTLKEVKDWSKQTFGKRFEVMGILFLKNIKKNCVSRLPTHQRLIDLGGREAIRKLLIVTTHWDDIKPEKGQTNEESFQELCLPLLRRGARMNRFDKSHATAWRILNQLLA